MSKHFPKPYEPLGGYVKVELDLSNYATTAGLERATGVNTSNVAAKPDLASWKAEIDKIDEDKFRQSKQCSK